MTEHRIDTGSPEEIECPICDGSKAVDSGGFLPWGEAIFVKCSYCNGIGKVANGPDYKIEGKEW